MFEVGKLKVLVLDSCPEAGKELITGLQTFGYLFDAIYTATMEQFKNNLDDASLHFIITRGAADRRSSAAEALEAYISSSLECPFLVFAPDGKRDVVEWMKKGAADVAVSLEHLGLIMQRHADQRSQQNVQERSKHIDISAELTRTLSEPDDRKGKYYLIANIADWDSVSAPLSKDDRDQLLSVICQELSRLSGDRLVCEVYEESRIQLYLESATDNAATVLAEKICEHMNNLFIDLPSRSVQVGLHMAVVPLAEIDGVCTLDDLHTRANELIAEAAAQGINHYQIFTASQELERQASEGDALALVQHALDHQGFRLFYQPVASMKEGDQEYYEVLLRIVDPKGKEVSAGKFIGEIERTPLAAKIDKWVVLQSVKKILEHKERSTSLHLFLHLSSASLQDRKFVPWLFLLLKKAGLPANALVFQVSEENFVRYKADALQSLKGLGKIGVRTSLCRFGSTLNPMAVVKAFPTDYVKLDGSLTSKLVEDAEEEKVMRKTITELQDLGRKTIVPQIESPTAMTRVWRTGPDYVQGFFLQKPKPDMDYDFSSEN